MSDRSELEVTNTDELLGEMGLAQCEGGDGQLCVGARDGRVVVYAREGFGFTLTPAHARRMARALDAAANQLEN